MYQVKISEAQKALFEILNQTFEIEKKVAKLNEPNSISRNISKLKNIFENGILTDGGLIIDNPLGEAYDITRTDCEASIAGSSTENLIITEVIKPIIRIKIGNIKQIVQKGVVIVQSKESSEGV